MAAANSNFKSFTFGPIRLYTWRWEDGTLAWGADIWFFGIQARMRAWLPDYISFPRRSRRGWWYRYGWFAPWSDV